MIPLIVDVALAVEGMWLPEQAPEVAAPYVADGRFHLDPKALADPMGQPLGAIVSLGGCSASFVSPDGLILTNHHCVGDWLQYNASADRDLPRTGYTAASPADELTGGPGNSVYVVERIEDVTTAIVGKAAKAKDDAARQAAIERAVKGSVQACEAADAGVKCEVEAFWGGSEWRRITYRELRDVRLVYAPPESLGQFGGDIDNWMWPRHGADFSVLRAYVAPDGKGAAYAKENVPYRPKHHLELDPAGVRAGDVVFAVGFPGSTERTHLEVELRHEATVAIPEGMALSAEWLDILRRWSAQDPAAAGRLANPIDGIANGYKYSQGVLDNLKAVDALGEKARREAALRAWIAADPARKAKYQAAAEELAARVQAELVEADRDRVARSLMRASDLLPVAYRAYRLAEERKKPDLDREFGYQDRDLEDLRNSFVRLDRTLHLPSDRDLLAATLRRHAALPAARQIAPIAAWVAAQGGVDAALDALYRDPALAKTDARLALLDQPLPALVASKDPWMGLARAYAAWDAPRRAAKKAHAGAMSRLMPIWLAADRERAGAGAYPDANGTMRFTIGTVTGYAPKDGLYAVPFTTLRGLRAKVGPAPFDAPAEVVARAADGAKSPYAAKELGDVPVNFLSDLDSTGGNSGSATLNGDGRLIGLLFDGNYESMVADWVFDPALTRTLHVDVRFVLWVLEGDPKSKWIADAFAKKPK